MAEWSSLLLLAAGIVLYLVVGAIVAWAADKRLKSALRHAQEYNYTTSSTTLYQQNRTGMLLGIFVVWPVVVLRVFFQDIIVPWVVWPVVAVSVLLAIYVFDAWDYLTRRPE